MSIVDFAKLRGPTDAPYGEADWNTTTYNQAMAFPDDGMGNFLAYGASKAIADKAAFDYAKQNKVSFQLTAWVSSEDRR